MRRGLWGDHARSATAWPAHRPAPWCLRLRELRQHPDHRLERVRAIGSSRPGSFFMQLGHLPFMLQTRIPHNSQARRKARAV